MINLNNLRVFYLVAKHKSVLLAAEKLFISQPAVSNALKKIQKELNTSLFEKNGRNLELTEKGKTIYDYAKKIFETEQEINDYLANIEKNNSINVGIVTLYERFAMLDIMAKLESIDEDLTISVRSGNSKRLIQLLEENEVDMAITGDLRQDEKSKLIFSLYAKHQNYLVVPKGHPLFGRKFFAPQEIDSERMVLKEKGSSVRRNVERYFAKNNIKIKVIAEFSNLDSLLDVIKHERCLTFLPDMAIEVMFKNSEDFSFALPISDDISFNIYLVTHEENYYPSHIWQKIQTFIANSRT